MRAELRWNGPASVASPYCWNKELKPLTDLRSLGEVATGERRGHYRLDKLIARHGADAGARVIVRGLTADCPQQGSAYNVVDDEPLIERALDNALAHAAGRKFYIRAPGRLALLLGDGMTSLTGSLRVSNARLKQATRRAPASHSARAGLEATARTIRLGDRE